MKILIVLLAVQMPILANAKVQTYPEPETQGPRGQCYETVDCDNENHAAMLMPLELCARVLKRDNVEKASWKELGSHVCVTINMNTVQE